MTHTAEHIVVNFVTPIEVAGVRTRGWIVAAILVGLGIIIGAVFL